MWFCDSSVGNTRQAGSQGSCLSLHVLWVLWVIGVLCQLLCSMRGRHQKAGGSYCNLHGAHGASVRGRRKGHPSSSSCIPCSLHTPSTLTWIPLIPPPISIPFSAWHAGYMRSSCPFGAGRRSKTAYLYLKYCFWVKKKMLYSVQVAMTPWCGFAG